MDLRPKPNGGGGLVWGKSESVYGAFGAECTQYPRKKCRK